METNSTKKYNIFSKNLNKTTYFFFGFLNHLNPALKQKKQPKTIKNLKNIIIKTKDLSNKTPLDPNKYPINIDLSNFSLKYIVENPIITNIQQYIFRNIFGNLENILFKNNFSKKTIKKKYGIVLAKLFEL